MTVEDHLIALERSLHSSAVRSDPEATGELLAEDFREFGASGRVFSRKEILAELAGETAYPIDGLDFECRLLSSDLALLTYVSTSPGRRARRTSLWRLEGAQWRCFFHQGTPIPPHLD